jgi:outer membrane autotransporter protein
MKFSTSSSLYALCRAGLGIAAAALPAQAMAQSATVTASDVNALNLLSPFLSLNASATGQSTLTYNLNDALTVNQFAAGSSTIAAVSISDKTIFSGNSTSITLPSGASAAYGPGANLAGGLPTQMVQSTGGIAPYQQYGGLGNLGTAYQAAVSPTSAQVPSVVTLLNNAYSFTSQDLGVAKYYFANGTVDGSTTAVAPSGYKLPTANGYPNTSTSVYDAAYGVSNTGANQDTYGDSRPSQVSNRVNGYDPTALTGLATNPSFPSGHTTYAFTDSILTGMMVPQYFQAMLLRASEYGNSRIDLGVHYPLDIIASRSFVSYDLAQLLNAGSSVYTQTNTLSSPTSQNLNTQFQTAAKALNGYLGGQTSSCGGSIAACAASNPYNTYSATTYASAPFVTNTGSTTSSINSAIYDSRMAYGLPTLSYAQAPREQAPAGGPDASILLATLYGGANSNAATAALAASVGGGLYGNLANSTINQIIVNTETNALAAFYGTSLSYWSRVDLYDAAGYFQNVTGTITLASTDQVNTNVTVANTGTLNGGGTITGNLAVQSGGTLGGTGAAPAITTVNGQVTQGAGSTLSVNIDGKTAGNGAGNYSQINVVGTGNAYVISPAGGSTPAAALQFNLRNITGGNNTYIPGLGSAYTVVQAAGGVSGAFGSLVQPTSGLPANTVFTVAYYPTNVQGYVTPGSYANPVAAGFTPTGNQAGVGSALDRIRAATGYGVSADSNTSVLLGAVGGLSAGNLQAGLDQLSGVGALNAVGNSLTVGRAFGQALDSRLDQLHGADTSIAEKASQGLFGFALNTGTIGGGSVDAGGSAGATTGLAGGDGLIGLSPWVRGIGVFSSNDGDGNAPGFSSTIGGALAGVDYRLNDAFLVGASFGYAHSTVTGNDGTGQSDGDSYRFAGYGTWNPGGFFVDGTAGYTYSEYDTRRDLAMGSFSGTAKGNTSGGDAEVGARVGKRFNLGGFTVVPDAGLTYDHLTTDRFTESGAGAFNLTVGSTTLDSLRSAIGASASQTFQVNEGLTLEPEVRAHWEHDILDQNVQTSMALAGQPFTVSSARPGRDAAVLGVGLAGLIGDRTRLFVSYDASLRENQTDHAITAGFKLVW